jgi:hypothetical protein
MYKLFIRFSFENISQRFPFYSLLYSYIGSIIFSYSLVIVLKHEILKNVKKNNSRIIDDVRSDYLFEFSLTVFIFPHNVICQFFVKNLYVLCSLSNGRPFNFFLVRSAIH